jgi:PEP-CTERM motif
MSNRYSAAIAVACSLFIGAPFAAAQPANLTEDFDDIATLVPSGWFLQNNSTPGGLTNWFQGNTTTFPPHTGIGYLAANFDNTTGNNTISNWAATPTLTIGNGTVFRFFTRSVDVPPFFGDRLQVRMSTNGASTDVGTSPTDVGDFTRLLLDINAAYISTGYPMSWTQFTVTVSGLPNTTTGRFAFRYFVENGGPLGTNSNYIGIDTLTVVGVPEPTSLALLGISAIGGMIWRRRRTKA